MSDANTCPRHGQSYAPAICDVCRDCLVDTCSIPVIKMGERKKDEK